MRIRTQSKKDKIKRRVLVTKNFEQRELGVSTLFICSFLIKKKKKQLNVFPLIIWFYLLIFPRILESFALNLSTDTPCIRKVLLADAYETWSSKSQLRGGNSATCGKMSSWNAGSWWLVDLLLMNIPGWYFCWEVFEKVSFIHLMMLTHSCNTQHSETE